MSFKYDLKDYLEFVDLFFTAQAERLKLPLLPSSPMKKHLIFAINTLHVNKVLMARGGMPAMLLGMGRDWVGLYWPSIDSDPNQFSLLAKEDGTYCFRDERGTFITTLEKFVQMFKGLALRGPNDPLIPIEKIPRFQVYVDPATPSPPAAPKQ